MDATGPSLSETERDIMRATYRALCAHGYANLTMGAIADEFDKSQSLIHYHYETKQDLLTAFLDFLLDRLAEKVADVDADDPEARLELLLDVLLLGPEDAEDFQTAMLELRVQAPYEERYRDQLAANDASVRALLEEVVASGVEAGAFAPVAPERAADLVLIAIEGARSRRVVFGDEEPIRRTRETILTLLREGSIAQSAPEAAPGEGGPTE